MCGVLPVDFVIRGVLSETRSVIEVLEPKWIACFEEFLRLSGVAEGDLIGLGDNIPTCDLVQLNNLYEEIVFVSNFTVTRSINNVLNYLNEMHKQVIEDTPNSILLIGRRLKDFMQENLPEKITLYNSLDNLVKDL